jgi:preprotein translocase subunit SecA
MADVPLRRLPDEVKEKVEAGFAEALRVYRDRQIILGAVDSLWVRHLTDLSILREGIGLRAFGQQAPLVAYRKEAHEMYQALLGRVQSQVARSVFLVRREAIAQPRRQRQLRASRPGVPVDTQRLRQPRAATSASSQKLGRNDPCWCGSGKKYKNCHMRRDAEAQRGPVATVRPPKTPSRRRRRRR